MNPQYSLAISTLALCLVLAQCGSLAIGQSYGQQQQSYGGQQQRKLAPSPQMMSGGYGHQQAAVSAYPHKASSYARQQQPAAPAPAAYAAPAQSYAAPKPKYEEPYYPPMPFAWGYDINDGYGGAQFHKESGDEYGKRTGSYGYTDAYGIYRQVDYTADETGFHATVKTNEPGTANEAPADVEWHAYEPPSNHYAGQQQSYAAAAPAAAPVAAYAKPAPRPSYSAPAPRPSYSAPAQRPSYMAPVAAPAPVYHRQPQQQQQYQPSPYSQAPMMEQSYSSSQNVPVYSKQQQQQAVAPAQTRRNSY